MEPEPYPLIASSNGMHQDTTVNQQSDILKMPSKRLDVITMVYDQGKTGTSGSYLSDWVPGSRRMDEYWFSDFVNLYTYA